MTNFQALADRFYYLTGISTFKIARSSEKMLWYVTGNKDSFDSIGYDDYIKSRYPDRYDDNKSCSENTEAIFGKEAVDLINKMLDYRKN